MSAKSGQSSELREVLARIQNAKSNKANADRRLKRAKSALDQAHADVSAADAELKEAEGLLMNALRKGMSGVLKDRDVALAIAETIANALDGSPPAASGQTSLPLVDGEDGGAAVSAEARGRASSPDVAPTAGTAAPRPVAAEVESGGGAAGAAADEDDAAPAANAA